jgi:hypothetical protein
VGHLSCKPARVGWFLMPWCGFNGLMCITPVSHWSQPVSSQTADDRNSGHLMRRHSSTLQCVSVCAPATGRKVDTVYTLQLNTWCSVFALNLVEQDLFYMCVSLYVFISCRAHGRMLAWDACFASGDHRAWQQRKPANNVDGRVSHDAPLCAVLQEVPCNRPRPVTHEQQETARELQGSGSAPWVR